MFINNPFGSDVLDITEDSSAERVGHRIRTIRLARNLSQAELGFKVGLTADRIQKYENGARKPKSDLLKSIADALEVSSLALTDPTTSSYINAMFTLFELENNFDMKIEQFGTKFCLSIDIGDGFYPYIKDWYEEYTRIQAELEVSTSEEEKQQLLKEYKIWEWTYPKALTDKTERKLQKLRIKNRIEELQKLYDKLDSEC